MRLLYIFIILCFSLEAKDYTKHYRAIQIINQLSKHHGFTRRELKSLFRNVRVQHAALCRVKPSHKLGKVRDTRSHKEVQKLRKILKKYGQWGRYARLKVNNCRARQGVAFIKRNRATFNAVEKKYGIPKEYIAAIIGIETAYGHNVGRYPVFDTLATLTFEKNRRNRFFRKELIKFLKLSKSEKFNPRNIRGSYSGAIGLGQFLPSNYEAYGIDFNKDGKITLQGSDDAIASIANYFKKNGWKKGQPVAIRVRYQGKRFFKYRTGYKYTYTQKSLRGIKPVYAWNYKGKVSLIKLKKKTYDELWYGTKNFFVITRYNHSDYYAMAVHKLAEKIKKKL